MATGRIRFPGRDGRHRGRRRRCARPGQPGRPQILDDLRWRTAPVAIPWAVALVILVVSVSLYPATVRFSGLATLTPLLGVLIIASLGQSLVIGTGGIDLSVSSVITVVGVVFVMESGAKGGSIGRALVYSLLMGMACGVTNGLLVEYLRLSPLVTTLATGQVMAGLASIWYGNGTNGLVVPSSWKQLTGDNFADGISYVLLIAVVAAVVLSIALSYTAVGRRLTVASTSPRAAGYLGIRARRYRALPTWLPRSSTAWPGVLFVGNIGTSTLTLGDAYQLSTIVAVVLGGAALSGGRLHPGGDRCRGTVPLSHQHRRSRFWDRARYSERHPGRRPGRARWRPPRPACYAPCAAEACAAPWNLQRTVPAKHRTTTGDALVQRRGR